VMLKGEEEMAEEQSEVSWDGTARERRRARKEHVMHSERQSSSRRIQTYRSQEKPTRSQSNRRSSYARSSSRRR
jgi:hypothetical protein